MSEPRQAFKRKDPAVRRDLLIAATARCLAKYGAQGVSVRAICKEAGVTPGLLRHYFTGIDDCIAEAYRATGERVEKALLCALDAAPQTPRDRLLAYLTASFAPPIADGELLATWLAFWGLTKTDARIADLHAQIYGTYRRNLEIFIGDYKPGDHRLTAVALTALVDGLWLELSLGNAPFTPEEASTLVEKWLDALLV
jgi:TetR/AcrR family transcriptional regulator, transcriptional repressor of bet genes